MYRRFLNNEDYLGIITQEAPFADDQREQRPVYPSGGVGRDEHCGVPVENYEIEQELGKGKYIAEYDRRITFPVGAHIYHEGRFARLSAP